MYDRLLMMTTSQRIARVALDLVFPPQCALCGTGGTLLCDACVGELPKAGGPRCLHCSLPSAASLCGQCANEPPSFESLSAAFVMDGGARRLVHELKYGGLTSLAAPMAELLSGVDLPPGIDVVAPVPLHARRERSRGYNQSELLARRIASMRGLPFGARLARRVRDTAPLARAMDREERRMIVKGAFSGDAGRIDGLRVLLVDDVCTTGATLDACTRALLDAGAAGVACIVWARAD